MAESKARPTCIIVSILTAGVEHSNLICPLEMHDWFGYHTTILQDDEISGASSWVSLFTHHTVCRMTSPVCGDEHERLTTLNI